MIFAASLRIDVSSIIGVGILVGSNEDYLLVGDDRNVELVGDCVGLSKRTDRRNTLSRNTMNNQGSKSQSLRQ